MHAFVTAFVTPKHGNADDECEDATVVIPAAAPDERIANPVSIVVSDGASESLLARDWARHLTDVVAEVIHRNPSTLTQNVGIADAVLEAATRWSAWIADYETRRAERECPVRWYERPKLERGAYATLLVLHFDGATNWWAGALGDSCLFQIRGSELIRAFPVERSDDFDSSPGLVNSRGQDRELLAANIELASGDADFGDQFFLCTDALAAWFLGRTESGDRPWDELMEYTRAGDELEFYGWVAAERETGRMRNDDVAIVHLDFG